MEFLIELNGLLNKVNIVPLGSYGALIGMDYLEKDRAKLECDYKVLESIDDEGRPQLVKGVPK